MGVLVGSFKSPARPFPAPVSPLLQSFAFALAFAWRASGAPPARSLPLQACHNGSRTEGRLTGSPP